MTLEQLRKEVFTEGDQHTKVVILRDYHIDDFHGNKIRIEFAPTSRLVARGTALGVGAGDDPYLVPAGSVVGVTADGVPPKEPLETSDYDGYEHYFLHAHQRTLAIGSYETNSPHPSITGTILWARETGSGGVYSDDYLLKPSPEARQALVASVEAEQLESNTAKYGRLRWTGSGPAENEYLRSICKRIGLSDSTVFHGFSRADSDWTIGIDPETGLVFWSYYDT